MDYWQMLLARAGIVIIWNKSKDRYEAWEGNKVKCFAGDLAELQNDLCEILADDIQTMNEEYDD